MESPTHTKCSGKGGCSFVELIKHKSYDPASWGAGGGSPSTVFVKPFYNWRNGIIISYEWNCSVRRVLCLHMAWTPLGGPVQVEKRGEGQHAEPRSSQVRQSHHVFIIIKPKKHKPAWTGAAWRPGCSQGEVPPGSNLARSPEGTACGTCSVFGELVFLSASVGPGGSSPLFT